MQIMSMLRLTIAVADLGIRDAVSDEEQPLKGKADSTAAAACRHHALNASAILGRFIGLAINRRSAIRSSEGTGPLGKPRLEACS